MNRLISTLRDIVENSEFAGKTYLVGGFVRDLVLSRSSYDIDILVDLPNGGIKLANYLYKKGIVSKPVIFPRFGTAQVEWQNYKLEFVMSRAEKYKHNSRKPTVRNASLYEDIRRRDFTINTLLMDISNGEILDLLNQGKSDIANKIIRTTQEPQRIFQEDPLRMLRAVRFAVQLNFSIEKNTYKALTEQAKSLGKISWERKRDEVSKIIISDSPVRGMNLLKDTKLLRMIIPELIPTSGCYQNEFHYEDVWDHTMRVTKAVPNDLLLRFAALLHDIGKPQSKTLGNKKNNFYGHEKISAHMAEIILKRFKFSNDFIKKVKFLILNHLRTHNFGTNSEIVTDKKIRKLIYDADYLLNELLELIHADNLAKKNAKKKQVPELKRRISKLNFGKSKFPVKGNDIMKYFSIPPGEKVGKLLKQAKEIWLQHPEWDKEAILRKLNKVRH
ncbi:MAG: HD domain-containing protein [Candidatus Cloacimonadota bacterium]|nr:HD domain-containing protein [Candidatus Cloacimonadota bacterium]